MSGANELDRRAVLGLLAASSLGLVVGGCSFFGDETAAGCEDVAGGYEPTPGLVAIGTRYRELYPDDDPSEVGGAVPDREGRVDVPPAPVFAERVRADFDAGDVVDVDGWVLARSEARLAALLTDC
jgi:hypothetical protein